MNYENVKNSIIIATATASIAVAVIWGTVGLASDASETGTEPNTLAAVAPDVITPVLAIPEITEATSDVSETQKPATPTVSILSFRKIDNQAEKSSASFSVMSVRAENQAVETDAVETDSIETDAVETVAPETQAAETDAVETTAPESEAVEAKAPETHVVETDAVETTAPESEAVETTAPEAEVKTFVLTDEERELLEKIVETELRGDGEELYEAKLAICCVIANRVLIEQRCFPDTITEVIFQKVNGTNQFSSVTDYENRVPSEITKKAVEDCFTRGIRNLPPYVTFMVAKSHHQTWFKNNLELFDGDEYHNYYYEAHQKELYEQKNANTHVLAFFCSY